MFKTTEEQRKRAADYRKKYPDKVKETKRRAQQAKPELYKDYQLQYKYGISIDQYKTMLAAQNECCAICNKHYSKFKRSLHVDHCYKTGKVRKLLCIICNRGLSILEDKDLFNKYLNYLKENN